MIITKSRPYTKEEIDKLKEQFDVYIKTVIDVEKKIRESNKVLFPGSHMNQKIIIESPALLILAEGTVTPDNP